MPSRCRQAFAIATELDDHQRSRLTDPSLEAVAAPARRHWRALLRSRDAHVDAARCGLATRGQQGATRPLSPRVRAPEWRSGARLLRMTGEASGATLPSLAQIARSAAVASRQRP